LITSDLLTGYYYIIYFVMFVLVVVNKTHVLLEVCGKEILVYGYQTKVIPL